MDYDETVCLSETETNGCSIKDSRRGFSSCDILDSPIGFRRPVGPKKPMPTSSFVISPPKASKKLAEPDPVPRMEMKQFQPKEVLDFKEVLVRKSKTLYLELYNPSVNRQTIMFSKVPKQATGFSIDNQQNLEAVESRELMKMGVSFEPEKAGKFCDSLLITTNEGHRLQISLVGSGFVPVQKPVRLGPNRKGTLSRNTTRIIKPQPPVASSVPSVLLEVNNNRRQSLSRNETFCRGPLTEVKARQSPDIELPVISKSLDLDAIEEEEKRKKKEIETKIAASIKIQAAWKGYYTRKKVEKMLTKRLQLRAASIISKAWRAHSLKSSINRKIKSRRDLRQRSATVIQSAFRGHLTRRKVRKLKETKAAVAVISKAWKSYCLRCLIERKIQERREAEERQRILCEKAATVIQSVWRGHKTRRLLQEEKQRLQEERRLAACIKIQAACRGFLVRKQVAQLILLRKRAVCIIERSWKSYCFRTSINQWIQSRKELRNRSATVIQAAFRGHLSRKQVRQLKETKAAVAVIARAWKSYSLRSEIQRRVQVKKEIRESAATIIQSVFRGYKCRIMLLQEKQRIEDEKRRVAAIKIQASWRGYQARKEVERMLALESHAVSVISRAWKAFLFRKFINRKIKTRQDARERAAIVIQSACRVYLARRQLRQLIKARDAASVIARAWKSYCKRRERERKIQEVRDIQESAATIIQSVWKGYRTRMILLQEKQRLEDEKRFQAALKIQASWRGYYTRKEVAKLFEVQRKAVCIIEKAWKAYSFVSYINKSIQSRKEHRNRAAIVIQAAYRGYRVRRIKFEENRKLEEARRRVSELIRNTIPSMTLGYRTSYAIDEISRHSHFSRLGDHLDALIVTSKMSPDSCVTMSHPLVLNELKKVFSTCNRCDPAVGAVAKIMEMVLNLAKYAPSRANLLNDSDFIDVCIDSVKKHVRKSDKDGVISTLTLLYILLKEEPTFDLKTTSIRNLILILKPMKKDFERDGKRVTRKVYNFLPYWSAIKSGLDHFEKKEQAFVAVMGLVQKNATLTGKFRELF